jgi:ATP-dependent DNA helicase 2 subunit 1
VGLAPTDFKSSGQGISLLNNLISDVNSKQVAKRALFSSMPLEIGPDFKISVKGFNILQKQAPARSCYIYDKGEELQRVTGTTSLSADSEDSKHTINKEDIKKAYKFAGTQVLFTEQEQKELKNWGSPVIRIIGFKPQSSLPVWAAIKKSTFIYPSEESFVGSTRVFSALWQKLRKDKKMGVAWFIARARAAPTLVAILPSEERLDEATNRQISPAGLWLYPLPFADDLRSLPPVSSTAHEVTAPDELIDQMRDVVKQLQLPKGIYDPHKYPNRNLQWHYKLLQVLALEEEAPEEMEDKTIPKYRQIQKYSGEYISRWSVTLEEKFRKFQHEAWGDTGGKPKKREAQGDDDDDQPKKRVKAEKSSALADMTNDEVRKLVAKGTLGKHSVQDLKDFLNAKGQKTTGKKADLLERLEQWLEDN